MSLMTHISSSAMYAKNAFAGDNLPDFLVQMDTNEDKCIAEDRNRVRKFTELNSGDIPAIVGFALGFGLFGGTMGSLAGDATFEKDRSMLKAVLGTTCGLIIGGAMGVSLTYRGIKNYKYHQVREYVTAERIRRLQIKIAMIDKELTHFNENDKETIQRCFLNQRYYRLNSINNLYLFITTKD